MAFKLIVNASARFVRLTKKIIKSNTISVRVVSSQRLDS
jgi:hypothetical protein